ncbi:hypothetical protein KC19_10G022000 [Ceratodon purpureus]|uniref:Uncharacterized protein n=1 Tax=Ceratodon purpureus TaxID=3225 RepID=A0A8T0GJD7_CERPU|nr:hypothetical protein KC19_10G022000 [Ceratodon purpureus]
MPGVMSLRPVAAATKTSRRSSRLSEKITEERERVSNPPTNVKASKGHPITCIMPSLRPAAVSNSRVCRAKQVTDPWPENVKARLVGGGRVVEKVNYSSSGSEHEPSSNCLAAMVHEYMEKEESGKCGRARCNCESGSCNCVSSGLEDDDSKSSLGGELSEVLQGLAPCVDAHETALLAEVFKAMDGYANVDGQDATQERGGHGRRRRSVMKHLQISGYNAALCKSRWDHAGSFPGGDYEYIDVVFARLDGPEARLIVDIDFQGQFEIARPTSQYKHVYQALPAVYVGTSDRLLQIVNVMSEAVKRSLKKKGMFLPPWRKPEYVKAKWFSSYKRTTNGSPQSKDSVDSDIMSNMSMVAMRNTEWDKKFTNEMEREFEKAGSRQVTRDEVKNEDAEPEGVVRGANRLKHLWADVKSDVPREIHELDNMDWQPPALLPRASTRRSTSTGLTLVLREAGLIGSSRQSNNLVAAM